MSVHILQTASANSTNGVVKRKQNTTTSKFKISFKRWWKSILYFVGVLTTIITIGMVGYLINDKLTTFMSKEEAKDLVTKTDLMVIETSLKNLEKREETQNIRFQRIEDTILKIYNQLLENHENP